MSTLFAFVMFVVILRIPHNTVTVSWLRVIIVTVNNLIKYEGEYLEHMNLMITGDLCTKHKVSIIV